MGNAVQRVGRRTLAALVLVAAGYLVFKLALGVVSAAVWVVVAVLVVVAVIWALRAL